VLLVALVLCAAAASAKAQERGERIALKLRDGSDARLEQGELVAMRTELGPLRRILAERGVRHGALARTFGRSAAALRSDRIRAERKSGRKLPELELFFNVSVPEGSDAKALAAALSALPEVESAQLWPTPLPAPVDLAPPTPDFSGAQTYTAAAPAGIGSAALAGVAGADGAGTRFVDIEYEWRLDHEDLELLPIAVIATGTAQNPFPDDGSHGNAVLGILSARANGYGVTGLVPAAQARVAASYTTENFWDVGHAIMQALATLLPGDVMVIPILQQICVCGNSCAGGSQSGAGPVEWFAPWRAAIETAIASGVIVVEAAGNGAADLDATSCGGVFNRALSDSGAVIVAAGSALSHAPLSYSSYGSRVDVQGVAEGITTLGDGSLFDPGDVRQRYQANFGGSSSASAMVAGVLLAVQGLRLANGLPPLDPVAARDLLVQTGTPQAADSRQIGPLPDLAQAYAVGLAPAIPVLPAPVALALVALLFAVVARRALSR